MTYSPVSFGPNSKGSAVSLQTSYINGTLSTLTMGTPVSVNTAGQMIPVDITNDASVSGFLGIVAQDTPNGASGLVLASGRLENLTTSFAIGDPVYINTSGALINIRPGVGIGTFNVGDFCIFVGVIVQNQYNPSNKDLMLHKEVVGQL